MPVSDIAPLSRVPRCTVHGLALAPGGRCSRCADAARSSARLIRLAVGGAIFMMLSGVGLGVATARARQSAASASVSVTPPKPESLIGPLYDLHVAGPDDAAQLAASDGRNGGPSVSAPPPYVESSRPSTILAQWKRELAKAEAAERRAKAAAETQALADALATPAPERANSGTWDRPAPRAPARLIGHGFSSRSRGCAYKAAYRRAAQQGPAAVAALEAESAANDRILGVDPTASVDKARWEAEWKK